ncbi:MULTISPECIES: MFS transporter [Brevibacillus]|uniref:MFS transporter n=1 Tax=Brevibacillus TaxID=55080 RepID=UPI00156B0085|nr:MULTISPECIES: MFS transporter [Brevibacillus]MBH0332569.1 Fosmidomycin resistance protein [Brevibacillus brevis]NRR01615.1 MFS transporter [Brevibacillus sp. RS1.1]NRS47576.1 MFS transporter [Brevibacillus sp. HB2.2]UIO40923.1 MFS transporter [Brevibacillus brevis]
MSASSTPIHSTPAGTAAPTVYRMLFAISIAHLLNDSLQAVIPALLPIVEKNLALTFTQVGMILLVMNLTSSVLQPFVGYYSDRKSIPILPPLALIVSGLGMLALAFSGNYYFVLAAVACVGIGSAIFHPEASRFAHLASGPRRGLGQSIFQVGGNAGQALAPLMTILVFANLGQTGAAWFLLPALLASGILLYVALWYRGQQRLKKATAAPVTYTNLNKRLIALGLLIVIVSVRSWMNAGYQSFYQFYLMYVKDMDYANAQLVIFGFLFAGAIGTFFGGPLSDRFGKRNLLIISTLGSLPLTLLTPYVSGFWAFPLLVISGFIMLSSFSVTVVYAQELLPGKIGTVSGLIIGLAFGMGGMGALVFGYLADLYSLSFVILLCSFLPLIGFMGFLLPKDKTLREWAH